MDDDEQNELHLLRLANEQGKFAIPIAAGVSGKHQQALERLQLRDWVRLIDVTILAHGKEGALYRVFRASDEAMAYVRRMGAH